MKSITVIGEALVEIMADQPGQGFLSPLALTGPYPSGAPAIFASQAARLGQTVALISAIGRDDFGTLLIARLSADGVDTSAIAVHPDLPTGTAFVRYRPDGTRDFVFNIRHSASGATTLTAAAQAILAQTDHLHVMGTALFSPALLQANLTAIDLVRARGGTVSFDPNLRKEMLDAPGMRDALTRILTLCDLYLPSGPELTLLTTAQTEVAALPELLTLGPRAIVLKRGSDGATYHDATQTLHHPAFPVPEVDPTGAGDCFGAAFVCLWLRGLPPAHCLKLACAAGALAVTQRGPMEGAGTLAQLHQLTTPAPEPLNPV
jgi:sugar/nucleoside kinase (ribokinase family)